MRARRLRSPVQGVAVVLILVFWAQALARHRDQLQTYPWRVAWPALLAAQVLLLVRAVLLGSAGGTPCA